MFKWVLHENKLNKYEELQKDGIDDFENVFPVLNFEIRKALELEFDVPERVNKYPIYHNHITEFYNKFLETPEFLEIIPLHKGFLKVKPTQVNRTNLDSNQMIFGDNKTNTIPHYGIKEGGPYEKTPYKNIHFFFIFHADDVNMATTVNTYLSKGLEWFKGLEKYVKIHFHTEKGFSIYFKDRDNPLPEIDNILQERTFQDDVKYFAIYITPYSRTETDPDKHKVYYKLKEMLLKRDIASQVIDPVKIVESGTEYTNSLTNISIAILAKLKGTPWRLRSPLKNELIVGVGAFKHIDSDVQYIGSAFSFNNNGSFNCFEYFLKHEIKILAGSISRQIREFATVNKNPDRLIIHFYKTMSDEELEPIQEALETLELSIPVFIVSINKTESEDVVSFDMSWSEKMPLSGTYISIGENKFLLFNNTRYSEGPYSGKDGWPFPVKLKIDCTDKTQLDDGRVIRELIDQVYQFSRMYWKSVRQQNLPVTIKYPEIVAQMAPYFDGVEIPQYGKDNLWFL